MDKIERHLCTSNDTITEHFVDEVSAQQKEPDENLWYFSSDGGQTPLKAEEIAQFLGKKNWIWISSFEGFFVKSDADAACIEKELSDAQLN